ncbi:hypothetical protein [Hydrogenophaga sp.]|uniref:hypothetical protein n=1 Tax=Hydrogenophaga sp. TaxID=1904254 RepID=UPI003F72CF29
MGEVLNRRQPLRTINLSVHPEADGLVSIHMQHPQGLRTTLQLDDEETSNLIDTLIDALEIIQPPAPKPRIAVTLIRKKA